MPPHVLRIMRSRKVVAAVVVVVVLLAVGVTAAKLGSWGPFAPDAVQQTPVTDPTLPVSEPSVEPTPTGPTTAAPTYSPDPTDVPSDPVTEQPAPTEAPEAADTVQVVVTYASWEPQSAAVEVGAYVAAVDAPGTCTLTLTQAGRTQTQTIDALSDASTMSCGGFLISGSDLSPGAWDAVVSYTSTQLSGSSEPVKVVVP